MRESRHSLRFITLFFLVFITLLGCKEANKVKTKNAQLITRDIRNQSSALISEDRSIGLFRPYEFSHDTLGHISDQVFQLTYKPLMIR